MSSITWLWRGVRGGGGEGAEDGGEGVGGSEGGGRCNTNFTGLIYFSQKRGFDISYKLSPIETILHEMSNPIF